VASKPFLLSVLPYGLLAHIEKKQNEKNTIAVLMEFTILVPF
jgi:hypothetical protein